MVCLPCCTLVISDVDLFFYGLSEAQARAKMTVLFQRIKETLPDCRTQEEKPLVCRTPHTVTYLRKGERHLQCILRLHSCKQEVVEAFDVDACGLLYVLLRFFFSIFGPDYSFGAMLLNVVLLPAAILGFLLLSFVAIFQTDLRRMLAYSSVAQIGYIVAAVSLASQSGVTAGIVHIVNHGIIKAALFMSVGCILYQVGHTHSGRGKELALAKAV